uniref:CaM_binding domain-containing protein n=1 Tax=Elaeophora elaphi TaxID=1147741 RepID=A0A158Q8G1_9BILA
MEKKTSSGIFVVVPVDSSNLICAFTVAELALYVAYQSIAVFFVITGCLAVDFQQTGDRIQSVSFSFKVPNTRCLKKSELIMSPVKRNFSDTDLKPPVRAVIRSGSASNVLENAVLERAKTTLISKLASDGNSAQDSSCGKNSNTSECILKSNLLSSCSWNPKKRKIEGKADAKSPIKLKKKVDPKKRALVGKTISMTPSAATNDKVGRNGNKRFPGVVCSSSLAAALNRQSEYAIIRGMFGCHNKKKMNCTLQKPNGVESQNYSAVETNFLCRITPMLMRWEKLAMKTRSVFLKNRREKMLKDRLKKYSVVAPKSHLDNSEKLDAKKTAVPKFNQDFPDLFSNSVNKKEVEQRETSCGSNDSMTLAEKSTSSKKNSNHEISEFVIQGTKETSFCSPNEILLLTATNGSSQKVMNNKSDVKELPFNGVTRDPEEIAVTKEVEYLVEKALRQSGSSSCFRIDQDLRKNASDNVQECRNFGMTNDSEKLRKMWALVAEESSLTNSLKNISAKINKIKTDLYAFSNESSQISKRLDEVRILKDQLLHNSECKFYLNFKLRTKVLIRLMSAVEWFDSNIFSHGYSVDWLHWGQLLLLETGNRVKNWMNSYDSFIYFLVSSNRFLKIMMIHLARVYREVHIQFVERGQIGNKMILLVKHISSSTGKERHQESKQY